MGKSTISMVISNSYVKLPEGNRSLVSHISLPILSLDWVGQRLKRDMVALAVAYLFGLGNFESAKHDIFAGMII